MLANDPPANALPSNTPPSNKLPGNAVADRLIAGGRRPLVLGFLSVESVDHLAGALFEALAHVSDGADGIDLALPAALGPRERLAAADQLAEATGASLYLRSDAPMAGGDHTLIVSAAAGRLRSSANVIYDVGTDWPLPDDERPSLLSTLGFGQLSDAALMGVASAASERGLAAVSTDRARVVRRVVDTLAPLYPKVPKSGVT